ncbi:MAG: exo-alpha-sialidase [Clostridia bacterium]|nr:exo-alpha-sialidase [Clostridia bacterium]
MKKIILHILTAAILFSMATLFVSAEAEVTLESFATVMPNHGKAGTVKVGEQIFTDRTKHFFGKDTPDWLLGQSFLCGSLVEGNTVTVTEDGFVYVITPVSTKTNSQATVLLANGFTETASIDSYKIATTISEPLTVLGKAVKAGDTVTFGKWGILLANINEAYSQGSLSLTAPTVLLNPTDAEYIDGGRQWQGIPGITRDPKSGRLWATWYSGGSGEGAYNFVLLYTSEDDGTTWTGPVLAIDHEYPVRCFDPNLWVDPDGRMWMFWSQSYFHFDGICGTWMMYTDNPESENPTWSTPVRVANGIAMNDPVVLANGDWILPTAIWEKNLGIAEMAAETNSNAYISKDKGITWQYLGSVQGYEGERSCDENMIIEQNDGSLRMLIRTGLGIEESYSYDGGVTWTKSTDAGISKVVSRFYITRLSSGNQLLIYNDPPNDGTKRSHMTAALSTDDGKTWKYKFVIDARSSTTYPDAVEDKDGNIYIIYDCTRSVHGNIVMAKITEADIMAGKLVTSTSKLRVLINDNQAKQTEKTADTPSAAGVELKMTVGKTEYTVNGEKKTMDVAPIIRNSRTMLPVRYVAEALGATVVWDGDTSTATITTAGTSLKITVGASEAVVNGQAVQLDSPAFIENSRTYMPVRFVAETLGATVAWDGTTSTATITK